MFLITNEEDWLSHCPCGANLEKNRWCGLCDVRDDAVGTCYFAHDQFIKGRPWQDLIESVWIKARASCGTNYRVDDVF